MPNRRLCSFTRSLSGRNNAVSVMVKDIDAVTNDNNIAGSMAGIQQPPLQCAVGLSMKRLVQISVIVMDSASLNISSRLDRCRHIVAGPLNAG